MPTAFSVHGLLAKYGKCINCGNQIERGEDFTFGRKTNAGKIWHSSACPARSGASVMTVPLSTVKPPAIPPVALDDISSAISKANEQAFDADGGLVAAVTSGTTLTSSINPRTWPKQVDAFMEAGCKRMLLIGPPGTGKSTIAATGYKFRVTCNEDMGREDLVGTFLQIDGNTVWTDGAAVRAMKLGTRLVLDEIDKASQEAMSLLYALLDDKPQVMLPTGEFVEAADGYEVIATTNGNPADLPEAILDRLEAIIVADKPNQEAYEHLSVDGNAEIQSIVALMQNHYRDTSKSGFAWKAKPSLRRIAAYVRFRKAGIKDTLVAEVVFGDAGKEVLSAMVTAGKVVR
jgi:hypothetical protein